MTMALSSKAHVMKPQVVTVERVGCSPGARKVRKFNWPRVHLPGSCKDTQSAPAGAPIG